MCTMEWQNLMIPCFAFTCHHYSDVIIGLMASYITGVTIVYSTVCSDADQRKRKSSASLCGEFTGDRWIPRTKGRWRGKCFHLMTSSYDYCNSIYYHTIMSISRWLLTIPLGMRMTPFELFVDVWSWVYNFNQIYNASRDTIHHTGKVYIKSCKREQTISEWDSDPHSINLPWSSYADMKFCIHSFLRKHYSDVMMGAMASHITSITIVYWTVYSGAAQRKHQSTAPMAFV